MADPALLASRWAYYLRSIPTLLLGTREPLAVLRLFLGLPLARPARVTLRGGQRFYVRSAMDLWIVKETCLDRQYEAASTAIQPGWRVMDIGAGLGDFTVEAARAGAALVVAYEPFVESLDLLRRNLALNGVTSARVHAAAVSGARGPARLSLSSRAAVSHSTAHGASDGVEVPGVTLEEALDTNGLDACDYLKVDCEGAEFEMLLGASEATLGRLRHVCLEYHDNATPHRHTDLARRFEAHGFRVQLTPNPAHRHLGLLYAWRG